MIEARLARFCVLRRFIRATEPLAHVGADLGGQTRPSISKHILR